jgi:hypothetical protein
MYHCMYELLAIDNQPVNFNQIRSWQVQSNSGSDQGTVLPTCLCVMDLVKQKICTLMFKRRSVFVQCFLTCVHIPSNLQLNTENGCICFLGF